ncbi:nuclear nucleic acid-binding protein C1D [Xenentodon cancila]
MSAERTSEDYPQEIDEQLAAFESSVTAVKTVLEQLVSASRRDVLHQLDPLDQAKLDLMSAYTLNSLFWMYLVTQGINPREHGIKQELERIRTYMNRVKEITDKKKAGRLDKGAASRFVRNALYDPEDKDPKKTGAPKRASDTASEFPRSKHPKRS